MQEGTETDGSLLPWKSANVKKRAEIAFIPINFTTPVIKCVIVRGDKDRKMGYPAHDDERRYAFMVVSRRIFVG